MAGEFHLTVTPTLVLSQAIKFCAWSAVGGWVTLASHNMGTVNLVLLAITLALELFLASVLLRRNVYWQFPFFFAYVVSTIVATAAQLAANSHYRVYFIVYWISEGLLALLAILALHEVFRRVFLGFYVQFRWFRMLFPAAIAGTLLFIFWDTPHNKASLTGPIIRTILLLGISVNFLQAGLFCVFIAIGRTFRLRWRYAPLGIILGFAIAAIGSAIAYWTRSVFGTQFRFVSNYGAPVAYLLAITIWLDTFLRPEPEPKWISAATMRQVAEEIRQDAMILKKIMEKLK